VHLTTSKEPIGFVFVVYWDGKIGEDLMQYFVLRDQSGSALDETPKIKPQLKPGTLQMSAAIFYAIFPYAGRYGIQIYQNDVRTHEIPLEIIETNSVPSKFEFVNRE
jgi:hypothetical protein